MDSSFFHYEHLEKVNGEGVDMFETTVYHNCTNTTNTVNTDDAVYDMPWICIRVIHTARIGFIHIVYEEYLSRLI